MLGLFAKKSRSPERRRFERIADDSAMIVLHNVSYGVVDWSLGGFRALGYRGGPGVGDEMRGRLVISHGGEAMGFNAKIRILRADEQAGELAGQFVEMPDSDRKRFERVYQAKLNLLVAAET